MSELITDIGRTIMGELTDKWGQSMGGDQETMMMVTTFMSSEV